MKFAMKLPLAVMALTFGFTFALAIQTHAAMPAAATRSGFMLAQAMVPPTGMDGRGTSDADERALPQALPAAGPRRRPHRPACARRNASHARPCPAKSCARRTTRSSLSSPIAGGSAGCGRPVAVPIEVVGIEGRQLASLDMPRSEYAAAPTWRNAGRASAARRRNDQDRAGAALSPAS